MAKYGRFKYGEEQYGVPKWIYERTQADLDADNEYAYINYWDLNRIETRTRELIDAIPEDNDFAWLKSTMRTKTDWEKVTEINYAENTPTAEQTNRIINNIHMLWIYPYQMGDSAFHDHRSKIPTTMDNLDIYDMNNLELALFYMYLMKDGALTATVNITYTADQDPSNWQNIIVQIKSATAVRVDGKSIECKFNTKPISYNTSIIKDIWLRAVYSDGIVEVSAAQFFTSGIPQVRIRTGTHTETLTVKIS